jgi:DNA-binding protein HU-beta
MATTKKTMSKTQVVAHFAQTFGMPRAMAKDLLQELAELAIKETKTNGAFTLPGIGKFTKSERQARMGRNPRTGEPVQIPAKTVVKMRLAKVFKDAVNPVKK